MRPRSRYPKRSSKMNDKMEGIESEAIRLICKRGKVLFVTRPLLIQSSRYFAAIFSEGCSWKETTNGAIELDSWPRDDLATILQSLKSKETEVIFANLNHYFTAINYFSIHPLMEQCIDFKINNISDDSVVDELEFAERFSVMALKEKCMEYLLRRLPDVIRGSRKSRRKMSAELLEKLLRHENLTVRREDEILSLINTWSSWGKRQSERSKLLQYVRFAHITKSAFEKCSQDPQCLQLPKFRRLMETPRWSDLDDELLSGRKTSRVHYHVVGFLRTIYKEQRESLLKYDEHANGVVVYCSESGTMSTAREAIHEVYATATIDYTSSVTFGAGLYVFQRPKYPAHLPTGETVESFSGYNHYSDIRNPTPSLTVKFRSNAYAVAPPVTFKNNVYVLRMLFRGRPVLREGRHILDPSDSENLELVRYCKGRSSMKFFALRVQYFSLPRICQTLAPGTNAIYVDDKWTMLCLPNQQTLVVLESPHPVGPSIGFGEWCYRISFPHKIRSKVHSGMVVVGNVAYILLKFFFWDSIPSQTSERRTNNGKIHSGTISAYDLIEGKWIPGHFVDLGPLIAEKTTSNSFGGERFELFLRVVQDEVFLILVSNRIERRHSGFPGTSINYAYRLERSANSLWLSPVSDSAFVTPNKLLKQDQYMAFMWIGRPLYVDTHPCEYASALQVKASQEDDPVEREKLRRYIW